MSGTSEGARRGWKTRKHLLPPVEQERRARRRVYENAPRTRKASNEYVRSLWARGHLSTSQYDKFRYATERQYEEMRRNNRPTVPRAPRKRKAKASAPANMGPYGPVPTGGRFPSRQTVKREGRKRTRHTGTTVPRQGSRTRRTSGEIAAEYAGAREGLRYYRTHGGRENRRSREG
jgi:hypothetical protein